MLEELRLNPRSQAARLTACCARLSAAARDREVDPRLSTGFAGRTALRSTSKKGVAG